MTPDEWMSMLLATAGKPGLLNQPFAGPPPAPPQPPGFSLSLDGGGGAMSRGGGGGGRIGVEFPIGDYRAGGGIAGMYNQFNPPGGRTERDARLLGLDAFLQMPSGGRLSGEYAARPRTDDPRKMHKSYMLRYGWDF